MYIIFLFILGVSFGLNYNTNKRNIFMKNIHTSNNNYLYTPKTENQKIYVKYLDSKIDFILSVIGPAGTGKTLLACNKAIDDLKKRNIDKIIITRPVVPVEEELGFLPGNIEKKMDPWIRPIFDIFLETYSKSEINNMIMNGIIEISPLGFMRGRTFKNSFIIADEMQNSSPNQMLMLLTRIGENSKMVITGDLAQSDRIENNGLKDFIYKIKNNKVPENFYLIEMDEGDIQRSQIVNDILRLYKLNEKKNDAIKNIEPLKEDLIKKSIENKNLVRDTTENGNRDAALIPRKDMQKNY
jgi:phosphate starvation-inducible PhoH-like protein